LECRNFAGIAHKFHSGSISQKKARIEKKFPCSKHAFKILRPMLFEHGVLPQLYAHRCMTYEKGKAARATSTIDFFLPPPLARILM
jgi:hypothetical protein